MKRRKMNKSDDAVVGVVVTVLIIGLAIAVMVMVQNVYVPQWVEEKEANHMEDVLNQFTQLKYTLDLQSIINGTTAVSTTVNLGSQDIPFFDTGKTFGSLKMVSDSCKLKIESNSTNKTYTSDSIEYVSGNSYFVNQQFIYQGGAFILSQHDADVLYGKPSIIVTRDDYAKNISFVFVNITGVGGNSTLSGYGPYAIYTEINSPNMNYVEFRNVSNITITSEYLDSWNSSIRRSFLQPGLKINYSSVKQADDTLFVEFLDDEELDTDYNVFVREVRVSSELGFGLVNTKL